MLLDIRVVVLRFLLEGSVVVTGNPYCLEDCQSWPAIFGACLARPSPRHLRNLVREQCEQLGAFKGERDPSILRCLNEPIICCLQKLRHGWAPVFLRHGVPLPGFHMAALG